MFDGCAFIDPTFVSAPKNSQYHNNPYEHPGNQKPNVLLFQTAPAHFPSLHLKPPLLSSSPTETEMCLVVKLPKESFTHQVPRQSLLRILFPTRNSVLLCTLVIGIRNLDLKRRCNKYPSSCLLTSQFMSSSGGKNRFRG